MPEIELDDNEVLCLKPYLSNTEGSPFLEVEGASETPIVGEETTITGDQAEKETLNEVAPGYPTGHPAKEVWG